MKFIIGLMLMSTVVFGQSPGSSQDLKKDMVNFDQAFIPLWFYVYEGNINKAKSAVFYVNFKWQQLKNRHELSINHADWQDAFSKTDQWLKDAYTAIDHNDTRLALNQLNHARYEMIELRQLYHISYYLDEVYRFQSVVQSVAEIVHDDKLCLLEWNEVESMIGRMNTAWVKLEQTQQNMKAFNLSKEKLQKIKSGKDRIVKHLLIFNNKVKEANQLLLAEAIRPLEREALYQMRLFGKFDSYQSYYASR